MGRYRACEPSRAASRDARHEPKQHAGLRHRLYGCGVPNAQSSSGSTSGSSGKHLIRPSKMIAPLRSALAKTAAGFRSSLCCLRVKASEATALSDVRFTRMNRRPRQGPALSEPVPHGRLSVAFGLNPSIPQSRQAMHQSARQAQRDCYPP